MNPVRCAHSLAGDARTLPDCKVLAAAYTPRPQANPLLPQVKIPAGRRTGGDQLIQGERDFSGAQTMPWAIMASATFRKPATFAPTIRSPGLPHSTEAS